jgi:hypothetical protein
LGTLKKKRSASYFLVSTLVMMGAIIRPIKKITTIEVTARANVEDMFYYACSEDS